MMKWDSVVSLLLNAVIIGLAVYVAIVRRNLKVTFASFCMICSVLLLEANNWSNEEFAWTWIVGGGLMVAASILLHQTRNEE